MVKVGAPRSIAEKAEKEGNTVTKVAGKKRVEASVDGAEEEQQAGATVLSQAEVKQRVEEAKELFANVNVDFVLKIASVNEARARGDVVTPEEVRMLKPAHKEGDRARPKLDKANG